MLILDAAQTAHALPYEKLVPAIAQAATQLATGALTAPERLVVPVAGGGVLLCMPALGVDIGVTKLITVHGANAAHGVPAIQGEVIVFDAATGRRLLLLDGPTVTARRTAAVTLLGIQQLAPRPASVLLIGTGVQAAAHAQALHDFFGVRDFRIASRNEAQAHRFCAALTTHDAHTVATPVTPAALPACCEEVDVVIALTTSTVPVVPATLAPRTLAVGVGAFKPEMAELPAALLQARRIVVDHLAGARHEAGDLLQAGIDWNGVRDLAQLLAENGAPQGEGLVLKTVGHAAWDLAAARVALASSAYTAA